MKTQFILRLAAPFYEQVRADLARPHPFAAERVGFLFTRMGTGSPGTTLLFPVVYLALPDEQYVEENDPEVGAAITGGAIRGAMLQVLQTGMGAFHVHVHAYHRGQPRISPADCRD